MRKGYYGHKWQETRTSDRGLDLDRGTFVFGPKSSVLGLGLDFEILETGGIIKS